MFERKDRENAEKARHMAQVEIERERAKLESEKERLEAERSSLDAERSRLESLLERIETRAERIEAVEDRLEELEDALEDREEELGAQEEKLEEATSLDELLDVVSDKVPHLLRGIRRAVSSPSENQRFAESIAAFYKTLVDSGMDPDTANTLTLTHMSNLQRTIEPRDVFLDYDLPKPPRRGRRVTTTRVEWDKPFAPGTEPVWPFDEKAESPDSPEHSHPHPHEKEEEE